MKTKALQKFRSKFAQDQPVLGFWVTLESPSITEAVVGLGLDWVAIDAEHGHLDWNEITQHVRATVRSDTVALVRIARRDTALAKRALDIGADGIIIPSVETADELQEAVLDCRFPTEGRRGIGGERATVWGQGLVQHTAEANENVLVVPIIESVLAIDAVPAMCRVDGVDVLFIGPSDFSATAGHRGQWEGPGVAEQILGLKDVIRDAGRQCGIMATSDADLINRQNQGFRMLALGQDMGYLLRGLHTSLQAVGRDRSVSTSLDPADGSPVAVVQERPPAHMEPDRDEVVTRRQDVASVELQAGIGFEPFVGAFNTARNLTTGIVTMRPESMFDYHTHPCSESITVLDGEAEIEVAGRVYQLGRLDNLVIPAWLPHTARNPRTDGECRLHVALGSKEVEVLPVQREFPRIEMPEDSPGFPGAERLNRIASASFYSLGPGNEAIDCFNADLMPGIEMSGGYARFQPGGRLPAHVHDFDESICIMGGTAICRVEGKRYELDGCATAMVPRGRVHYFINESPKMMEMIWVYAGPMPERIIVAERWVTEGSPWGE